MYIASTVLPGVEVMLDKCYDELYKSHDEYSCGKYAGALEATEGFLEDTFGEGNYVIEVVDGHHRILPSDTVGP